MGKRAMCAYTLALEINEYDSYVTHRMLRHYAGIIEELTPAFHMRFVQYCLCTQRNGKSGDEELDTYAAQLRTGMSGRSVMVLHDLGLDPMSDDWLAVALL